MQYLENINKIDTLFLTDIYEPRKNSLLLEVKGSVVADEETEVYVILFKNYIAYHVLNENFSVPDPNDEFIKIGHNRLRLFTKSGYMEYILKETLANDMFPNEMKHYGLYTEHHVIHIIAFKDPIIEMKVPNRY
ncbi:hypothetical protein SAMN04488101_10820 [Pedobacter nyackensis]|uniref:Uncharacterized protein n=2 Tax=Pedobacter nyackensis TaxID=475255 RepID=A0A1W2DTF8_9SPHI|nr:hypothetical protein SAMN04488101_10820 [Pedobacter nyackensis]